MSLNETEQSWLHLGMMVLAQLLEVELDTLSVERVTENEVEVYSKTQIFSFLRDTLDGSSEYINTGEDVVTTVIWKGWAPARE